MNSPSTGQYTSLTTIRQEFWSTSLKKNQLGRSSGGLSLLLPHKYNYVSQSFKSSTPRETGLVRLPRQVSRHLLFLSLVIILNLVSYILYSSVLKLYKPYYSKIKFEYSYGQFYLVRIVSQVYYKYNFNRELLGFLIGYIIFIKWEYSKFYASWF